MEKVEKLLLLVVLGAAMIIMAVMSFGSEEPTGTPPGGVLNGSTRSSGDPAPAKKTAETTEIDPAPNAGNEAGTRTINDLGIKDGPSLVSPREGDESNDEDLAAKPGGDIEAPNAGEAGAGEVAPGEPGAKKAGQSPVAPDISAGVDTAELALKPGEDAGIWIYRVQPNESMGGISERITGSTNNMHEIASFNEGMDLDRIRPGQEIQIPGYLIKGNKQSPGTAKSTSVTVGRQPVPGVVSSGRSRGPVAGSSHSDKTTAPRNASAKRVAGTEDHIIRKGETLWAIAKRRVGDRRAMAYVRQIQDLNPNLDPTNLQEKAHILLPAR